MHNNSDYLKVSHEFIKNCSDHMSFTHEDNMRINEICRTTNIITIVEDVKISNDNKTITLTGHSAMSNQYLGFKGKTVEELIDYINKYRK